MAVTTNLVLFFILFFVYGIYAAATEGVAKAWITNVADKKNTATAIGTFTSFQSICTMLASSMAGLLWFRFGAAIAFGVTAAMPLLVTIYFLLLKVSG